MVSKKCVECGFVGDKDVYFHPGSAKCKPCSRYIKRLRYRLEGKIRRKDSAETKRAYKVRYPEKHKAKIAINHLQKWVGFHFHHWSYNDEHLKDVLELTSKNHNKAHRFLVYDQERKMYRTTDGVLLDTKERHEAYIKDKIQNELD